MAKGRPKVSLLIQMVHVTSCKYLIGKHIRLFYCEMNQNFRPFENVY